MSEAIQKIQIGFNPYKLTFLLADGSGSEDELDEENSERVLFLQNQDSQLEELTTISLGPGGPQIDEPEGLEMNGELIGEDDSPLNMAPSQSVSDDLLTLLPNEAEVQKDQQQRNQQKKLQDKTYPKGKKVQKISTTEYYKMQMLTTEHQFKMKLMAEEYQRRMEMTRLEHEQRMKHMAEENSACLKRHALEIDLIRTKKEILNKKLMCLSNNLIFDYTHSGE